MGIQPMKVVVSRHGGLREGETSGDWKQAEETSRFLRERPSPTC